jgi:hypothetical protein
MRQDFKNFGKVKQVLEQVALETSITHNNGTAGQTLTGYIYDSEESDDPERLEVEKQMWVALRAKQLEQVKLLQAKLLTLNKTRKTLIFRLLEPIPKLVGTKIAYKENKSFQPSMDNVETFRIPEEVIDLGALEYEETDDVMPDRYGKDTAVIKLTLKACMLDVKESQQLWNNQIVPAHAYLTVISARSMQLVGKILSQEDSKNRRLFGYNTETN